MELEHSQKIDFVPNNESVVYDFADETDISLFSNNFVSEPIIIEDMPVDFIFSESEITKTFVVQHDGTLVQDDITVAVATEKILTRKRKRDPTKWKCNISKVNRQSGKSYMNRKGETRRARIVKEVGCANPAQCPFKCMEKIDTASRQAIYDSYWSLNDPEKRHFYAANVKRVSCERKRTKADVSRKSYTLNYYFNYNKMDIRVCQQFFINTLDVNKGRVYYFFSQSENRSTVTPGPPKHGKHPKKKLPEGQKQGVRDHINKFPAIESHYCREGTKKKYLDQGLNVSRMYRMYSTETDNPVKESAYRNIFDYEFNLSFFRPKKDRCDKCVESGIIRDPSEEQLNGFNAHIARKEKTHAERNRDRDVAKVNEDSKIGVISFDLENVFQLPIANASHLFYLRKFGVYVLTVFYNKTVYNVMWNEFICGREGTHLASALIKALKEIILDNPQLEHLILWSDSCVPQNRNSYMSAALQDFLTSESCGNVTTIDHKYSEAGHGEVQEVDNVHSLIENFIRHKFIYSPVSLINEFLKMESRQLKFKLLQMDDDDYNDYQALALASKYSVLPYTKVVQLRYIKTHPEISFKFDYAQCFTQKDILLKHNYVTPPMLIQLQVHSNISNLKIANLKSMFGIMPDIDKNYYETELTKLMKKRDSNGTTDVQNEVDEICGEAVQKMAKVTTKSKARKSKNEPKSGVPKCSIANQKVRKRSKKVAPKIEEVANDEKAGSERAQSAPKARSKSANHQPKTSKAAKSTQVIDQLF